MNNKELLKRYPFLRSNTPYNSETNDNEYTMLDDMPEGWRKCFGLQMCEDIKQALIKTGVDLNDYKVEQIKEKFGELRWYDFNGNSTVDEIIQKYEYLSAYVCIHCGKINVPLYGGWISPYCDKCAKDICMKDKQIRGAKLRNTFTVTKYSPQGIIEKKIDISDILEKIRDKEE